MKTYLGSLLDYRYLNIRSKVCKFRNVMFIEMLRIFNIVIIYNLNICIIFVCTRNNKKWLSLVKSLLRFPFSVMLFLLSFQHIVSSIGTFAPARSRSTEQAYISQSVSSICLLSLSLFSSKFPSLCL